MNRSFPDEVGKRPLQAKGICDQGYAGIKISEENKGMGNGSMCMEDGEGVGKLGGWKDRLGV